jgi:release factor glutamine methyltransferase
MNQVQKKWRVLELLKVTESLLKEKNIENPRLNAELMLCDVLNEPRIKLYLDFEKPVSELEIAEYRSKVKRRLNREPLQYILGHTEFFGLRFNVTPDVFIPRPETEILTEKAIDIISSFEMLNPKILEIGTGSGCIAVAIASKTNCLIDAIDNNNKALEVAESNSLQHNTSGKITFLYKNFFSDILSFGGYDIVISNPPYIPAYEIDAVQKEVKNFEPRIALTDECEGLSFYKRIFSLFNSAPNQLKLFLETGDGKSEILRELLDKFKIYKYEFYKDYHGIDRVLYINKEQN